MGVGGLMKAAFYCLIVLLCLIVGGAIGEGIGHRIGEPYDPSALFDGVREFANDVNGAGIGLLVGLAASLIIITVTARRCNEEE